MKLRFNQQPGRVTITIQTPGGQTFYEELDTHEVTMDIIEDGQIRVHFVGEPTFKQDWERTQRRRDIAEADEAYVPYRCEGCGKTSRLVAHAPGCPVQAAWDKENSRD